MKVLVIGKGVVGDATGYALEQLGHEVTYHDPPRGIVEREPERCDLALVCVPTPLLEDGELSPRYIAEAGAYLLGAEFAGFVGLRSTVGIGSTAAIAEYFGMTGRWFYWPEFLRAATARDDANLPRYKVFGLPGEMGVFDLRMSISPGGYVLTLEQAEFVKLATNALLAASVGVANELAALGATVGLKWNEVLPAMAAVDPNLPRNIRVTDEGGYGGACLPKDVASLVSQHGGQLPVLSAVHEANVSWRPECYPRGAEA